MHSSRMCTARSSSHRGRGVCLSACWDRPPWVWDWRTPPQVWAWRPPGQIPLNFPLACGPGDPPTRCPSTSPLGVDLETPWPDLPWVWAWRPLARSPSTSPLGVGLETYKSCLDTTTPLETCCHLQCMLGYHSPHPCEQNS